MQRIKPATSELVVRQTDQSTNNNDEDDDDNNNNNNGHYNENKLLKI